MKLYTEKQVKEIIDIAEFNKHLTHDDILKEFSPIELPSDEEIEEQAIEVTSFASGTAKTLIESYYYSGAKWMKKQILKQTFGCQGSNDTTSPNK